MMSNYGQKLTKLKSIKKPAEDAKVGFFDNEDIFKLREALVKMQDNVELVLAERELTAINRSSEQFKELQSAVNSLENNLKQGIDVNNFKDVIDAVNAIKINPIVNVPTPIANVENKIVVQDWRKEYMFSDSDKSESTTYVGFVNPSGGWYIERVTKSKTSDKARFVFGKSDYISNWGKRLKLDYKYLFEVFNNGR
jgi:hypothetical protein